MREAVWVVEKRPEPCDGRRASAQNGRAAPPAAYTGAVAPPNELSGFNLKRWG